MSEKCMASAAHHRVTAFKQDGLLEITFDEVEQPTLDTTACCGEKKGSAADKGGSGIHGSGGDKVGAVLISPFIKPGRR